MTKAFLISANVASGALAIIAGIAYFMHGCKDGTVTTGNSLEQDFLNLFQDGADNFTAITDAYKANETDNKTVATQAQMKVLCDDASEDFEIAYSKVSGTYCPTTNYSAQVINRAAYEINLKCLNKKLNNGDWTLEEIDLIEQKNQTTISAQNNCYCLAGVINAWPEGFNTTNATTPDCSALLKSQAQKAQEAGSSTIDAYGFGIGDRDGDYVFVAGFAFYRD